MMDVRIHDGEPFHPVRAAQIFDHDRFVVDIAEPPVAMDDRHRVMTGRPDDGKGVIDLSVHERIGHDKGTARRYHVGRRDAAFYIGDAKMSA